MAKDFLKQAPGRKPGSPELLKRALQEKTKSHRRKSSFATATGMTVQVDRTLGSRYELKYRISESKAHALAQFIKSYIHLDHYSRLQPNGAYPIVSLYLDSVDLRLCRQTLEGNKNRFKLRIRSYTDDLEYPRFFEIKRRMNSIIIKSRARVMDDGVSAFLSGLSPPTQRYLEDEETLRQFQFYVNSVAARPTVRVRYMRQAYEGDSENRVRITFDRQLAYNLSSEPIVTLGGTGWKYHPTNDVILEIKFTDFYPAWLTRMVKYFNLRSRSVSKYVSSVLDSCLIGYCAPRISV